MKRKEFLWMLLPCLLLAGVAAYFQRTGLRSTATGSPTPTPLAPLQFRITSVKQEPLSASETLAGYDTRFLVTVLQGPSLKQGAKSLYLLPGAEDVHLVGSSGKRLPNAPVRYEINGLLASSRWAPLLDRRHDETRLAFSVALSKIPPSEGAITLKGRIRGMVCDEQVTSAPSQMTTSRGTVSTNMAPVPLPLEIEVGQAGERSETAPEIKSCPLRLLRSQVKFSNSVGSVVELEIAYKRPIDQSSNSPANAGTPPGVPPSAPSPPPGAFPGTQMGALPNAPSFTFEDTRIVDETGREFPLTLGMGQNSFHSQVNSVSVSPSSSETVSATKHSITLSVQTSMIHGAKGRLTLKTLISADGCWPLAYSQQIRPAPKVASKP